MSSMWEKRLALSNLWFSTLLPSMFHWCQFSSSSIQIIIIFFQNSPTHICEVVSWDVPKFGGDLLSVFCFSFSLSFLFCYSNGMSTLSYNSVWNQFISANSIITCHFTISPVFHIYLPVMCICYYKENSRKSFIMLHNIVTFFEKLWRLILHILYTEVLSLNTKD